MDYTTNSNLKKPGYNDPVDIQDINDNMDIIDAQMAEMTKQLDDYSSYASGKDANGIYTVLDYKRADSTLYMKSTLSNADVNGNYQTAIWQFYNEAGDTVIDTKTWTITYDADGGIVSKVVA